MVFRRIDRGDSWRIQKLGFRLRYKARYGSKRSNEFNLIPWVLDAQARQPTLCVEIKTASQASEVLPVHLRDVMRAASSSLSGLKCTVGLGKSCFSGEERCYGSIGEPAELEPMSWDFPRPRGTLGCSSAVRTSRLRLSPQWAVMERKSSLSFKDTEPWNSVISVLLCDHTMLAARSSYRLIWLQNVRYSRQ